MSHTYCLFAVINHVGTLESGHYITYVQDRGEVRWHLVWLEHGRM